MSLQLIFVLVLNDLQLSLWGKKVHLTLQDTTLCCTATQMEDSLWLYVYIKFLLKQPKMEANLAPPIDSSLCNRGCFCFVASDDMEGLGWGYWRLNCQVSAEIVQIMKTSHTLDGKHPVYNTISIRARVIIAEEGDKSIHCAYNPWTGLQSKLLSLERLKIWVKEWVCLVWSWKSSTPC